jgi:hypothetical protein
MCRLLGVSTSGYHAWVKRRPSRRSESDAALSAEIRVAYEASRGTYGAPRIHAELVANGTRIGRKRVARLMTQAGLAGVSRRKFVVTTVRGDGRQAPDLVERDFTAEAPNLLWVADITYIPTWAGFLYLAVVLDAYSRRIVGWSMATTLAKQLVLDALNMALTTRRPRGVIHHSDQGSQIPRSSSAYVAARPACVHRWARSAMRMTTPCARASLRRSSASCWHAAGSRRRLRRAARPSSSSRASTTHAVAIHRSDTSRRSTMSGGITQRRSYPTHISLPPCSRPSRTLRAAFGDRLRRSLTAAPLGGRTSVRVGTEEWLRRGSNQRMSQARRTLTLCHHFR